MITTATTAAAIAIALLPAYCKRRLLVSLERHSGTTPTLLRLLHAAASKGGLRIGGCAAPLVQGIELLEGSIACLAAAAAALPRYTLLPLQRKVLLLLLLLLLHATTHTL